MEKQNKILENVIKIWKDSVWSKLISTAIIFAIATIWTKYSNYSSKQVYYFIIFLLTYKIPIFLFLSLIGLYFLLKVVLKFFKKKKDLIWDEQIGNYKFKELYTILSSQNYPIQTISMGYSGMKSPKEDLLSMFHSYSPLFNKGVGLDDDYNDGGYLYGVLGPKFVGYGLVDKIETKNLEIDVMDIKYQTSEIGHKFFAIIEKSIYLKDK